MIDFNNYLLLVTKFFFVLGAILYFIFSIIIVRQTTTMTRNVSDDFNPILVAFSYIHLVFAAILALFTLLVL